MPDRDAFTCPFCGNPGCWLDCPQADNDPDNPMNPPLEPTVAVPQQQQQQRKRHQRR